MTLKGPLFGATMKLYREWCLRPNQRRGCMLPVETIAKFERAPDAGYCSVYMFDEPSALDIRASASSAGLARFPVYTDTLSLDLDKGEEQLKRTQTVLDAKGLGYSVFDSGGKGFHVVIRLQSMVSGKNVPFSQREWANSLGVECDLSLYQAGHIISLPGRKHPKTGRRKTLVRVVEGATLTLPMLEAPAPVFAIADTDQSQLEQGLWRVLGFLQCEPGIGNRHTAIWSAAKHFADAGIEFDTALNLLLEANATWVEPKLADDVRTAVMQAYKQRNTSG